MRQNSINERCRSHLRSTNDSWRVDETYIKVKGQWQYLYRAVDSAANTLDLMFSAKRDTKAAKRFFRKVLGASHTIAPRVITVDKNAASHPPRLMRSKQKSGCRKISKLVRANTSTTPWSRIIALSNGESIQV